MYTLFLLLSVAPIVEAGRTIAERQATDGRRWGAPLPDPKLPVTWNFQSHATGGFVRAVGKDHLTLYRPAGTLLRCTFDPLTGQQTGVAETRHAEWPAKTFALGEDLAKGQYMRIATASNTYRAADVRVGDWVTIQYDRVNGIDTCTQISIHRRPGGAVPPAPGEKPWEFKKYHEQANADQNWEEKRLAYPRKYWPTYLGKDGNFYAAPFPSESTEYVVIRPVAPMPREAKPKP